jgi:hypothetical protein
MVCATDAGREGELIFRYIYEAAGCRKPVSRLWISSLTPDAMVEKADLPHRFQQVVTLCLETYETRVSDVYRTLRHKAIALAHFGGSFGISMPM